MVAVVVVLVVAVVVVVVVVMVAVVVVVVVVLVAVVVAVVVVVVVVGVGSGGGVIVAAISFIVLAICNSGIVKSCFSAFAKYSRTFTRRGSGTGVHIFNSTINPFRPYS